MPIKNYTTKVPVNTTVAQIQKLLSKKGVLSILNQYADDGSGKIVAMSFQIKVKDQTMPFRLPVKVDGVYKIMYGSKRPRDRQWAHEQAARVAWRIVKDWIDAQIALVEADCAELAEVFLPYALIAENTTMYEATMNNDMKLLT